MQTQGTWRRLVIGWTALALGGCPVDGGTTTPTGDTGGDPAATVAGDVGRTAAFGPEDDGIGTLFVAAFDVCAHDGTVLGAAVIPNADLSADDARVAWSIADLPQTTVYLASFQDDDGNADPAAPLPDVGDLVFTEDAGDGILDCVAVDLTGGDIDGVRIDLNTLEEAPVAAVSGEVGRTAAFAADGDGVGTVFVAAFDACALDGTLLGAAGIPNADLSSEASAVAFTIPDLPQTTVYLASFQDDDGNADPAAPLPDVGDLVFTEDAGDGVLDCVEVDLTGGDTDGVRIDLNQLEEAPTP